jgi:rubrerythrin
MRAYIGLSWYLELKVKLTVSKTRDNLKNAFAGESQANRRYIAFAWKADQEGFPQIAKLFRAAAEAETVHAMNHLEAMGEIKSTPNNLETAVSGETFEFQKMYPGKKFKTWSEIRYLLIEDAIKRRFWEYFMRDGLPIVKTHKKITREFKINEKKNHYNIH